MIYGLLYILISGLSYSVIHIVGLKVPSSLMLFLSVSYAIIFFNIINLKNIGIAYKVMLTDNRKAYFLILCSVATMSGLSFVIPVYFSPSAYSVNYFIISALCATTSMYFITKTNLSLIKCITFALLFVCFYVYCSFSYSGMHYVKFVVLSLVSGFSGYAYVRTSANIKNKLSATQVLAVRFWLLWLVSLIIVLYTNELNKLTMPTLLETLLISLLSMILPLYFSQRCIEKMGADKSSLVTATSPLATALIQLLILWHLPGGFADTLFALVLFALIVVFYFLEHLKK